MEFNDQHPKTLLDLIEAFASADDAPKASLAHARTGFRWLATAITNSRAKLSKSETRDVLASTPIRGFLAGDESLGVLTARIRKAIVDSSDFRGRETAARHAADNYTSCTRQVFRWAIAHHWLLTEMNQEPNETAIPTKLPKKGKPRARDAGILALTKTPYCYSPWSKRQIDCQARREQYIREHEGDLRCQKRVAHYKKLVASMRETHWTDNLQPFWTRFMDWATTSRTRGLRKGKKPIRPATIDKICGSLGSYCGYLLSDGHHTKSNLTPDALEAALDNEEFLRGYVDWMADRHRTLRRNDEYSPYVSVKVLKDIAWLIKEFVLPTRGAPSDQVDRRGIAANRVLDDYVQVPTPNKSVNTSLPTIVNVLEAAELIWNTSDMARSALESATMKRDALLLMIMMYLPLRLRNWQMAELGVHIYRETDGSWWARYPGEVIKNRKMVFCMLDESLWRFIDKYTGQGEYAGKGTCARDVIVRAAPKGIGDPQPDSPYFLPASGGKMLAKSAFYRNITRWTASVLGYRINPHLVRDIVCTGILSEDPDAVVTCAYVLGDSVSVVLRHYAHLTQKHAVSKAANVIRQQRQRRIEGDQEPPAASQSPAHLSTQPWPGMPGTGAAA